MSAATPAQVAYEHAERLVADALSGEKNYGPMNLADLTGEQIADLFDLMQERKARVRVHVLGKPYVGSPYTAPAKFRREGREVYLDSGLHGDWLWSESPARVQSLEVRQPNGRYTMIAERLVSR